MINLGLKKILIMIVIVGIIVNIISNFEVMINHADQAKITIITFYTISIIYFSFCRWREENKNYRNVYLSVILLCLLEIIYRFFDLYQRLPQVDVIAHILAGIVVTLLLVHRFKKSFKGIVFWNLVIAFGWEIGEMFFDNVFPGINKGLLRDFFIWDGVTDILAQVVGMLIVLIWRGKK